MHISTLSPLFPHLSWWGEREQNLTDPWSLQSHVGSCINDFLQVFCVDLSWRGLLIKVSTLGHFHLFKLRRVVKNGLLKNTAAGRMISFEKSIFTCSWLTREFFSLQAESTSQVRSWLLGLFAHPVNTAFVSSCLCGLQLRAGQAFFILRSFSFKSVCLFSASLWWWKQWGNTLSDTLLHR